MNNPHTIVRSLRRWLFMALSPLAAVLFAVALTLPAQAATVYNIIQPVNFTLTNPCNGENVAFSGNEHDTYNLTFDGNGGVHSDFNSNFQDVAGVGDQGNTYYEPAAYNESFNVQVGLEVTITETFTVVSNGSAPNFLLHADFHFTINANGTVTAYHNNFRTPCQG